MKESLIDANFNPEQPETLLYAPVPGKERLKLVAVEYVVPMALARRARRLYCHLGDSTLSEL